MIKKTFWLSALALAAACTGGNSGASNNAWFSGSGATATSSPHEAAVVAFRESPIVVEKSCLSCHTIGDQGGTVGPILDQLFNRRSEDWLRRWLKDPNAVKPGTKMPNFEFTPAEVNELLGYIRKLRKDIPSDVILASDASAPEKGRQLLDAYGCMACHRIGAEGRFIGVDLTWVGVRKTESWERHWLKNPEAWKPGTFMPSLGLSDPETEALAAYLHTLQGQANEASRRWETRSLFFLGGSPEVAGEMVYNRMGCWGCHGVGGKGSDKNPNAAPDEKVPELWGAKNRLSEEQIRSVIREGRKPASLNASQPAPPFACPAWGDAMNDREMNNLITYLNTLAPKERVWKFQ